MFFFHCGEARERKGVMFYTKSLWDGGNGAPGERVHVDFFFSFFLLLKGRGVGVNVFFP